MAVSRLAAKGSLESEEEPVQPRDPRTDETLIGKLAFSELPYFDVVDRPDFDTWIVTMPGQLDGNWRIHRQTGRAVWRLERI